MITIQIFPTVKTSKLTLGVDNLLHRVSKPNCKNRMSFIKYKITSKKQKDLNDINTILQRN